MIDDLKQCQNVWENTYFPNPDSNNEYSNYPWENENALPNEIIEKFINEISINDNTRILDFGCGTGRIGRYIEKKWDVLKTKVYYYDIAEIVFDTYLQDIPQNQKIRPNIDSIIGLEERAFHEVEQFDGVIIWGVLHHLPQNLREYAWHLIKSIIKPNGHILLAEFNDTDVLFKENRERISEITKNPTYAVSPIAMVQDSFDIIDLGIFKFNENQKLLEIYSYASKVDKENRVNKERALEYVIAKPNWLECQKNIFTRKMTDCADFSHLIVYEFKNSLNNPENRIGTYYTKKELSAMELWLKAMGLMSAYDQINNADLLHSSYSSLLFKDSLKRYSFIAESKVEESQTNSISIKIIKEEETLCDNLFNIILTTSGRLTFESFEEAYRRKKGEDFPWTFKITHFHNNDNSYHRGALNAIEELQYDDLYLYDVKSIKNYLKELDEQLKIATENLGLEDSIIKAIRLILLFITPTTLKNGEANDAIEKTYTAIVPPAFVTDIKDSKTKDVKSKQITAGGAIMFTKGSPFQIKFSKDDFIYSVLKWSSAFTTKSLVSYTKIESIKSAIAAIMSRNMSHNLGSHFLANTKNFYKQRVAEIENKNGFEDVCKEYRGNVVMLQYIQERMDFIATIVSGDQFPFGALNFKSQLLDVLTEDDHGKRHGKPTENFLLKYLVLSEGLTRGSDDDNALHNISLLVKYKNTAESKMLCYKGDGDKSENDIKNILSRLRLAVPGGLMARHAFFTIIENLIRNTAKHSKGGGDLDFIIELTKNENEIEVDLYTNREDKGAADIINSDYGNIEILKSDNSINKDFKGLKEILMCVLWLKGVDVAQVLFDIQNAREGDCRLSIINEYLIVDKKTIKKTIDGKETNDSIETLSYKFTLPLFEPYHVLKVGEDYNLIGDKIQLVNENVLKIHADVIVADEGLRKVPVKESVEDSSVRTLKDIFPRLCFKNLKECHEFSGPELMAEIHNETKNNVIWVNGTAFGSEDIKDGDVLFVASSNHMPKEYNIAFYDHFYNKNDSEKLKILNTLESKGILMESISGENYTRTICTKEFLEDDMLRYKVIEAMNARIVIMDERIFEEYKSKQNRINLTFPIPDQGSLASMTDYKNYTSYLMRNYYDKYTSMKSCIAKMESTMPFEKFKSSFLTTVHSKDLEKRTLERKNVFLYNCNSDYSKFIDLSGAEINEHFECDFISIHLGLVEKYISNYLLSYQTAPIEKAKEYGVREFIKMVYEKFHPKHMTIHSGRGNFSSDLETGLSHYPFISLSSLESAFNNCKYFLSELFQNTNYYGKGSFNHR